jgi:hypothetical protein
MISKKIKISLIHFCDHIIHEGEIILTGDYPNCDIKFTSSVTQDIEFQGHDYFQCLINLRIELEKQKYYLLCNGARQDFICGGMLRRSSCGCFGSIAKLGKYINRRDRVSVFDYAKPDLVGSVSKQKKYYNLYISSLPQIVSYSVESTDGTKLFSNSKRKDVIEQLCSHSDWQLLEKEDFSNKNLCRDGDRLWFVLSNTLKQNKWDVDIRITNYSIYILFTLDNTTQRETLLAFLNEQLRLNNVILQQI